jgi:hypothetical protein
MKTPMIGSRHLAPVLAVAVVTLTGCAAQTSTTTTLAPTTSSRVARSVHAVARRHTPRRHIRQRPRRTRPAVSSPAGGLVVSSASAEVVQSQPAPGSCHARGSGLYSLPDPSCTPGALNPAVTRATIGQTICVSGYTKTVRPSESITAPEKVSSMAAYGDAGTTHDYEYDHLVSLELGGAANDPRNLWPEPGASPNPKDSVENELHRMVCDGQIALARAQHIIATEWVAFARSHGQSAAAPAPALSAPSTTATVPSGGSSPDKPIADVNCSDFSSHAAAQAWFVAHGGSPANDVAGLDGSHDGVACQSLPQLFERSALHHLARLPTTPIPSGAWSSPHKPYVSCWTDHMRVTGWNRGIKADMKCISD